VLEISALECRKQSAECLRLRERPGIRVQEATILLTMARTWTAMANHKERLDAFQRESAPAGLTRRTQSRSEGWPPPLSRGGQTMEGP
jgi:hypothetical protein